MSHLPPDRIATLSRPQERDLRRTVEQIVDAVPLVPLLDDPVSQMVEQLPDVMRFFDFLLPVPEQVIEVPKILLDDVPMRTGVRDTQLAEQLVEVPTIVSWSLLKFIMEHVVVQRLVPMVQKVQLVGHQVWAAHYFDDELFWGLF